jgi:predicted RNA-binding Zn-ribbon protein involved in translation (DUF1610 family)
MYSHETAIKALQAYDKATHCPHDDTKLVYKMHDIDGTNLSETLTCPECGYGTPALL